MNHYTTSHKLKHCALTLIVLTASAISATTAHAAASYLLAYSKASYETSSSVFTLKADNTPVDVVHYFNEYSYAHLAYQGTTTFTVSLISGATITSFDISPHSYGLDAVATKSGATLTFSVPQVNSRYLLVKISTSSGAQENLFIAADPQETNAPTIGGNVIAITNSPYFADNTGSNLMTTTIQNAINDRSSAGGGTVYFTPGIYKIGNNIALKSNVTLYLAAGAVLRGSSNSADYTFSTTGSEQGPCNFVINGNVSNVAFKGRGMIDANSTVLETSGDSGPHRKGIISSSQSGSSLPNGIVIQDITVKDATTWTLNLEDSQNVTVQNVKLLNDYNVIHNDGYDICSVATALVNNCLAVTGDDCFCPKATSGNPLSNITYMNDVSYSLHGAGTKVGDQASGTTSSITFSNIDVISGYRGMSISHDQGSASYSNINFNNVRTETINNIGTSGEFRTAPFIFWTISGGDGPVSGVSVINCYIENTDGINGLIQGDSAAGLVSNIAFQGLKMDGVDITSNNYTTKITIGAYTTNITFGPAVITSGPPQITTAPAWVPSPAYAGQTTLATATVGGTTPFAYQWKAGLNGNYTNLTDSGNISGSTNATLTITGVQATNALSYVVVITNSLGSITSSVAPLVVLPPLPAQVAVQDGSPLTITHATVTNINQPFAVTAGASVMVVTLAERGARLSEPATLAWNGQTLNRTVQTAYNNGNQRSLAIYYLFNPSPGTNNITGTMTGAVSDTWLTAYTLTGVNTASAPIPGDVNTGTDGTGVYSLTMNLNGVTSGSWASVAAQYANFPDAVTVTGTGSTGTMITDTNYDVTGVTAGYVADLSPGAISLTTTWVRAAGPQKANFGALVFAPALTTSFTLNYGGNPIQIGIGGDWDNSNIWNPSGLPASANPGSSYEVVVGSRLRNPAALTYNVFPGATLTVDGDGVFENATVNNVGEIRFKNSNAGNSLAGGFYTTNYFPNLVLNGGQLNIGDNTSVVLQGQVTVATNSILYAGGGASTNQTFQIDAYLTGTGNLQVFNLNATNSDPVNSVVDITGTTNTFTGTWDVEVGPLVGSGTNSLGTNTITIGTSGILETTYPINNTNASLVLNGKMFLTQTDAFNSVVINGTPLAPGTYSAATLSGLYTNFPATFATLYGTTATSASGVIKVGTHPPAFSIQGEPVWTPATNYVGGSASATVTAAGATYYQWMAGLNGNYTNLTDGANVTGSATATLTLTNVQLSNALDYIVVVTNASGAATSAPPATLAVLSPGPATNFTLTYGGAPIVQGSGADWNTVNNWNPLGLSATASVVANPGSTFELPTGARLRTPATSMVFPGGQLTVDGSGIFENTGNNNPTNVSELRFRNGDAAMTNYFNSLVLNGGELDAGNDGTEIIQGSLTVATNSSLYVDSTATKDRGLRIDAQLTGAGNLFWHAWSGSLGGTNLQITGAGNTFSGQWTVDQGVLVGVGNNALGTNNIMVGTNGLPAALETLYDLNNSNGSLTLGANAQLFLHQNDTFARVVINGTALANGTYSCSALNSQFPNNFPPIWRKQAGSTFTTYSGQIVVNGGSALPPASPQITSLQMSGAGGLTLSATNGTPGGTWILLQSTNVALPLSLWLTNTTGTFDSSGNLSTNLANATTNLQQFYILMVQ